MTDWRSDGDSRLTIRGELVQRLTALLALFESGQKDGDRIGEELRGAENRVDPAQRRDPSAAGRTG
jgi:hypothetical protein